LVLIEGDFMYFAFTEEQAEEIRKQGISVIEYKMCIKKHLDVSMYIINRAFKRISKALCEIAEAAKKVSETFNNVYVHAFLDNNEKPVYKSPKLVCKCDIDYLKNKQVPNINIRLPRSNC
jgi:hypothetical protein